MGNYPNIDKRKRIRLAWIEASIRYVGRFASAEKAAYMDYFGVGAAQVCADQDLCLQAFQTHYGKSVVKKGGKLIAADEGLRSETVFEVPDIRTWLADAAGRAYCRFEDPRRTVPDELALRVVLAGIQTRKPIAIGYVSRTSGEGRKVISPHTLVDVAHRLHVRAFDHEKSRFADFVLTRIRYAGKLPASNRQAYVDMSGDDEWNSSEYLIIKPRDDLIEGDRLAVLRDMRLTSDYQRRLKISRAVLPYLEDQENSATNQFRELVSVRRDAPTDHDDGGGGEYG